MRLIKAMTLALALAAFVLPAQAVPVTINPGNCAGQWDVDFNGQFASGSRTVDLSDGIDKRGRRD